MYGKWSTCVYIAINLSYRINDVNDVNDRIPDPQKDGFSKKS